MLTCAVASRGARGHGHQPREAPLHVHTACRHTSAPWLVGLSLPRGFDWIVASSFPEPHCISSPKAPRQLQSRTQATVRRQCSARSQVCSAPRSLARAA